MRPPVGDGWDWRVSMYYGDGARPPRQPGHLAIETVHKGESSRDTELAAARSRADLGRIVMVPIGDRPGETWSERQIDGVWVSTRASRDDGGVQR